MVIQRQLAILIWCVLHSVVFQPARGGEDDYYRLMTVVASKAETESRSKNWKPSPDGLPLEISGMAFLDD